MERLSTRNSPLPLGPRSSPLTPHTSPLAVLISRTSVLAAANPVFGRYDDLKSAAENIDLMTTILSRFDLIFIVRDVRSVVEWVGATVG